VSGFVKWLAERRARRVLLIAAFFPLPFLGLVSAAIVVMTGALRGPREGLIDCAIALLLVVGLGVIAGTDPVFLGLTAAATWLVWLGLASIGGRFGSLTLAVQVAVILAVVGLCVFLLSVDDPAALWAVEIEKVYAQWADDSLVIEADVPAQARLMTGAVFGGVLLSILVPLLLGLSWAAQLTEVDFGEQFRNLNLGMIIGGLAAVAGLLALVGVETHGALMIFGVAFMLQGIAVLAWWVRVLGWPSWWWLPLVLGPLAVPLLLVLIVTLLAALGFVDNWDGLRRRAA
jgi:hypothetical protein